MVLQHVERRLSALMTKDEMLHVEMEETLTSGGEGIDVLCRKQESCDASWRVAGMTMLICDDILEKLRAIEINVDVLRRLCRKLKRKLQLKLKYEEPEDSGYMNETILTRFAVHVK